MTFCLYFLEPSSSGEGWEGCFSEVSRTVGSDWIIPVVQDPSSSRASVKTIWPYLFYILGLHMFAKGNYVAEYILKTPE